jgi:hypothetical protein
MVLGASANLIFLPVDKQLLVIILFAAVTKLTVNKEHEADTLRFRRRGA